MPTSKLRFFDSFPLLDLSKDGMFIRGSLKGEDSKIEGFSWNAIRCVVFTALVPPIFSTITLKLSTQKYVNTVSSDSGKIGNTSNSFSALCRANSAKEVSISHT